MSATQVRPAHVWTAAGLLLGGLALYIAWIVPPELALSYRNVLRPHWVSWGYPEDLVPPGKLRQTLILFATVCFAITAAWHAAGALLRKSRTRFWPVLAVLATLIGAFVLVFGNRQFGGCDETLAIDVGWRLFRGQQPYRDFICTLPAGFFLPAKWAFQLFGASWGSLTILTAVFASGMFVWQALLLRKLLGNALVSLFVSATFQALAVLVASFWWYNPLTNAVALTFVLSALVLLREPPRRFVLISYTASLMLLASVKPNVAGLLIAGITVALLTSRAHRLYVIACSAIAFAGFMGILWMNDVALGDLLASYLSIARRAKPSPGAAVFDLTPLELGQALSAIVFALSPLWFLRGVRPRDWRRFAILLLTLLTGFYAIVAHGELKFLDLPFLLLASVIPILTIGAMSDVARRWTVTVCLTLLVIGATLGAMRHRVEKIGFGAFFEWKLDPRTPDYALFRALRTGQRFHTVTAQIQQVLRESGNGPVYFGPRLEGFYAATNRDSPRGLPPLLWHRNTFHPVDREEEIIEHFRRDEYDVLIFLYRDLTFFPDPMRKELFERYVVNVRHLTQYPELTILMPASRYRMPASRYRSGADELVQFGSYKFAHRLGEARIHADPKPAVHDRVGDR